MTATDVTERRLPRLESLTGLRWWAAFFVFAHHMTNLAPLPVHQFLRFGTTGVTFFFVLSGFVLTWSATTRVKAGTFYWRRFARIWPAHFVTLLLALPVFYSAVTTPNTWWIKEWNVGVILLSVVLLQAWSHAPGVLFAGNPASWTLSCEAFFYAFHPGVNKFVRRLQLRGALLFCLAVITAALGIRYSLHLRPDNPLSSLPLPVLRASEFLLGMGIAAAIRNGWRFPLPAPLTMVGFAVGLYGIYWMTLHRSVPGAVLVTNAANELLTLLYAAVIAAVATRDIRERTSFLRSRPLVALGQWSYCFYLIHATIIYAIREQWGMRPLGWQNLWMYAVILSLALVAAWGLYKWVEHPIEGRLRRFSIARSESARPLPHTRGPSEGVSANVDAACSSVPIRTQAIHSGQNATDHDTHRRIQ